MQAMTGHPTLCQDMGRIATLPGAMAVVRCPSLPAAINTEKGEDKERGGVYLRGGARAKQKKKEENGERRVKEQDWRGRRRAIVAPPLAPPSLLPATTDSTIIVQKIEEEQWQRVKRDERREKGIENRDCGLCTEKKKNRPHPLGTTDVLPLHRHNSIVILLPSTLPTPAEREREKRNRAEQRGKKKQRPRALHRGGEEKTAAPPSGIIVISPPSRCPDHLPLPPDHKWGRTEQTGQR